MKNNICNEKGIYIHIPFCSSPCLSCDFKSNYQENNDLVDRYIGALIKEFSILNSDEPIRTIYLGGGTPSSLNEKQLTRLLGELKKKIDLSKIEEFTIEARPEDLSLSKIKILKKNGINRVSLFVQELDKALEKLIGRGTLEKVVKETIDLLNQEEIKNISADLYFGLPNQNIDSLKITLGKLVSYNINHISIYPMTLEDRVEKMCMANNIKIVSTKEEETMYSYIIDYLKNSGFEHYELSNFSKNKQIAVHNSNYWRNVDYYGFGAAAHSKLNKIRYYNVENILSYIECIEKDSAAIFEKTELSIEEQIEEEFYLGLQMLNGINLSKIDKKYDVDTYKIYENIINKHLQEGSLIFENNILKLNRKSLLNTTEILSDFLLS